MIYFKTNYDLLLPKFNKVLLGFVVRIKEISNQASCVTRSYQVIYSEVSFQKCKLLLVR